VISGAVDEPLAFKLPVINKLPPTKKSFAILAPPATVKAPPAEKLLAFSVATTPMPPDTTNAPDVLLFVTVDENILTVPL
jgi:hypothetical protein